MKNLKLLIAVCAVACSQGTLAKVASESGLLEGVPPGLFGGPGNSLAGNDSDIFTGGQPNCIGDWISTTAVLNGGLDVPGNNEPGQITEGLSVLASLAAIAGSVTGTPACSTFAATPE